MLTEKKIQNILTKEYIDQRKHKVAIPNIYIYKWESDLLTVNRNNYCTEFEIKISRFDYINDFKKEDKHNAFKHLFDTSAMPNYFYYVCPDKLININDVPEYAGLIYIQQYNNWKPVIKKKAPILHKEIFEQWEVLCIKFSHKLID